MDAVELLVGQHRSLEARMEHLLEADEAERAALLTQVGDELGVHVASEEELFYPAVHATPTEDVLLESLEEHLSLKRLLADLLQMQPGEATFEAKFKVVKEQAEHHHEEEEEKLFPRARSLLGDAQREALGAQMMALQVRMKREGEPAEEMAGQTDKAAPLT